MKQKVNAPACNANVDPWSGYPVSSKSNGNPDSDAQPEHDADASMAPSEVPTPGPTNIPLAGLTPYPEPAPALVPATYANNIIEQHVAAESNQGAAQSLL